MKSRRRSVQTFLLLLLLPSIEGQADEGAAPPTHTSWHELPLPEGRGSVTGIAVEQGGVLWSLFVKGACYWDGSSFQTPSGDALRSENSLVPEPHARRNPDTGLYDFEAAGREATHHVA